MSIKSLLTCSAVLIIANFLTGCATIVGGSKYYAHITVKEHPRARIEYNGAFVGNGFALVKAPRAMANRFSLTIKEEGCEEQTFNFIQRKFRIGAFAGTLVGWTGVYQGVPLPWGIALDLTTGSLWKPSIEERGIFKIDYKHYNYLLDYEGCKSPVLRLN